MFFVARLVEHNSHIEDLCEPTRRHDENRPKMAMSRRSRASMIRNIAPMRASYPGKHSYSASRRRHL
jgi:hypothetical protein